MSISIEGTSGGSDYGREYKAFKARMWEAFSRLSFGQRAAILLGESWGILLFVGGLVVYHASVPVQYRFVKLFSMSAMAQTSGTSSGPPAWAFAVVGGFYFFLMLIMIGCVLFLLLSPGNWSNRQSWAAKTATFLLGFLTKAIEEWTRLLLHGLG